MRIEKMMGMGKILSEIIQYNFLDLKNMSLQTEDPSEFLGQQIKQNHNNMYHCKIPQTLQIYTEQKFSQEVSRIRMTLVLSSYSGGWKALEYGLPIPTQNSTHSQPINQDIFRPIKSKNFFFHSERYQRMLTFKQQQQQCQIQGCGCRDYIKQKEYVN